jgi:hypothetical protein
MEDALAASHDESEPSFWTDHQSKPAAVRRAGRQDENPLGLRSRGGISLDVPFYRAGRNNRELPKINFPDAGRLVSQEAACTMTP